MDLIELTRQLIAIPSYVDERGDEHHIGNFVFEYLQSLGGFYVEKQPVEGNRFNVIAHDGHPPRLMFCCHMDTVPPSGDWAHDPFRGDVEGDKLFGLGACDMKGGTAALLYALKSVKETRGLYVLFDVDEEYYFKGMLEFLRVNKVTPELCIFPEPGLKIGNGHRGVIEVDFKVRGISAHAARPDLGRNAILGASHAVDYLIKVLENYDHPVLGKTSCNLAWLKGGIDQGSGEIGCRANKIPDLAEAVLDIRPARAELRAKTVLDILEKDLEANGYQIEEARTALDFGSLYISPNKLAIFEDIVRKTLEKVEYENISEGGYGEGQLLNERLGTTCVYFGPGPKEKAHQVDEYVSITELQQATMIYRDLINLFCK